MPEGQIKGIANRIEQLWENSGAWPELIELMRQGISLGSGSGSTSHEISQWKSLPHLCCQAAGGHSEWAGDLAVAWLLFYSAAHLMDKVQDNDEPDAWWRDLGPGAALSAATGLYFSASLALNYLATNPHTNSCAAEIADDFQRGFLTMASGQYRDLSGPPTTLEDYWQRATAKSGSFFALACRSGARLATDDAGRLNSFQKYGKHLGLLVQIKDDLDDIQPSPGSIIPGQRRELANSLPVVYTLSLMPKEQRQRLLELLNDAPYDPGAAQDALSIVNDSGATIYVLSEVERLHHMALTSVEDAALPGKAKEELVNLVNTLTIPR